MDDHGRPGRVDELLAEELAGGTDACGRAQARRGRRRRRSAASRRSSAPGTALAGLEARALTPTFYQWIYGLYPDIPSEDQQGLREAHKLDAKIAPVQGFGIDRFVAEAKKKKSTWDVYVGMTPFVEMAALIDSGAIEPWDKYIPKSVLNDLIPSIRAEATYQGHIWSFPFLLDIIIQAWNGELVEKAGLDPTKAPKTWDEFIANAKKVVSSKAAPFGAVFDAHGWRSLAPIAHTFSTNVYTPAGPVRLHERRGRERARDHEADDGGRAEEHPRAGQDRRRRQPDAGRGGVRRTPGRLLRQVPERADALRRHVARPVGAADRRAAEGSRAAAARRCSGTRARRCSSTARTSSRPPTTCEFLTYDPRIWQHAQGKDVRGASGPARAVPVGLGEVDRRSPPPWMADWAFTVFKQLQTSQAIRTHKFGLTQFVIGQPGWEAYLKGDEKNPKKALAQGAGPRARGGQEDRVVATGPRSPCVPPELEAAGRWLAEQPPPGRRPAFTRVWRTTTRFARTWPYLLPALVFFLVWQLWPIVRVLWISFTDFSFMLDASPESANWVWFDNYVEAFQDPLVRDGLWSRAAIFTAIFLPGMVFLPMVIAVLVDRVAQPAGSRRPTG